MAKPGARPDVEILWTTSCYREVMQLLKLRGADFTPTQIKAITTRILKGPPRSLYKGNLSKGDFKKSKGRAIGLRLGKLAEGGAQLPKAAAKIADDYLARRAIPKDFPDQDEFLSWSGGAQWIAPPTAEDLVVKSPAEAANEIAAIGESWSGSHKVQSFARLNPEKAFDVMELMATNDEQREWVWNGFFHGLEESSSVEKFKRFAELLERLLTAHPQVVTKGAYGVSSWLAKISELDAIDGEPERRFLRIWDLAWHGALQNSEPAVVDDSDSLTAAINAPGGKLAEALLARLWKRNLDPGTKLPSDLRPLFDVMTAASQRSHRLARVILASRLFWLYRLDPAWSRDKLIARMIWKNDPSNNEFSSLWQGYLSTPYINAALIEDLEPAFIDALTHLNVLEKFSAEQLSRLFADILVEGPSYLDEGRKRVAIAKLPAEALTTMARHFRAKLDIVREKASTLWDQAISPVFEHYWPATVEAVTHETNEALGLMLLSTGKAFPNALKTILSKRLLSQAKGPTYIVTQLLDLGRTIQGTGESPPPLRYDIAAMHPIDTLKLLRAVLGPDTDYWSITDLPKLLAEFVKADVSLKESPNYRYLEELSRQG